MNLFKRLRLKYLIIVVIFSALIFHSFTSPAYANILNDILDKAKEVLTPDDSKKKGTINVTSNIVLAPNGDIDKNGNIDSGDIVRFEYTIDNSTSNEFSWLSLDTNIDRKSINFIHNIYGTTGFKDDGNNLIIQNLRIYPKQTLTIRFDARVNYSSKSDVDVSTEPKLKEKNNNVLTAGQRKQIKAKKISKDKFKGLVETTQPNETELTEDEESESTENNETELTEDEE